MTRPNAEHFLVTGALGCIGAWTIRALVRESARVVAFDQGSDRRRLEAIMTPAELGSVTHIVGDVTDLEALQTAIVRFGITNVIHLAALQVPQCRADPIIGAHVNVIGTITLFEAVKRSGIRMAPIVYTSSIGMFAADDVEADGLLRDRSAAHPTNHYGVYKLANEGTARVYWLDDGIASVGLRPLTVYGVGRDQGLTSGPTKAIVAAVLGQPFRVPFGGPTMFHYAEDVARTLITASRSTSDRAAVYNLGGAVADGARLVGAIETAVPEAIGLISFDPVDLPFPHDVDHDGIKDLGHIPLTPFEQGIAETVAVYQELARRDRLVPSDHGLVADRPRPAS